MTDTQLLQAFGFESKTYTLPELLKTTYFQKKYKGKSPAACQRALNRLTEGEHPILLTTHEPGKKRVVLPRQLAAYLRKTGECTQYQLNQIKHLLSDQTLEQFLDDCINNLKADPVD